MDKKYTVFISSTYEDLQEARSKVIESLLSLDCFPVGMEYFNASDDSQWEVIKRLIDESDYYVLIIAGRYGSVDGVSGLSYTQKEYEYAKQQGIPILTFIHGNMGAIPSQWTEQNNENRVKLGAFIEDAKTRLCKYWTSPNDLASSVVLGLVNAIKTKPRTGWIRADVETSAEANKEILRLREENDSLISKMKQIEESAPQGTESLAQGEDKYCVTFDYYDEKEDESRSDGKASFTWNQIYSTLAPYMVVECVEWQLINHFEQFVKDYLGEEYDVQDVHEHHFQNIKIQLLALGLIAESSKKKSASNVQVYWTLTSYGRKVMMQLKAIKKRVN